MPMSAADRRGSVDAVADHHHGVALGLGLLDEVCLVLGQHLGKEAVHAHLLCNGGSGAFAVAGHHDGVPDAQRTQAVQHSGGFRAQRVGDADDAHQLPAGCHVQVRIRGLEGIELLLLGCGDGTLFILKDEVVAADDHALAAHAACNAVGHDVLHLGVHLLMGNAALLVGTHHGVGMEWGSALPDMRPAAELRARCSRRRARPPLPAGWHG